MPKGLNGVLVHVTARTTCLYFGSFRYKSTMSGHTSDFTGRLFSGRFVAADIRLPLISGEHKMLGLNEYHRTCMKGHFSAHRLFQNVQQLEVWCLILKGQEMAFLM